MIYEIKLANFYSIKDEITLDLRAANIQTKQAKDLSENIFQNGKTDLLKTIAIYGANASGKSNLVKAIRFCISMVINSHNHNEDVIFNFVPHKFEDYKNKPSSFFIRFIHNAIEYEYSFELTRNEILKESLYYYPKGRITKVFERDEKGGKTKKEKYTFGNQITRPLDVAESTSIKTLFISRASQMDREIGKTVFNSLNENFILGILAPIDLRIEYYFNNYKKELLTALQIADSDISELTIRKEKVPVTRIDVKSDDNKNIQSSQSHSIEDKIFITSHHRKNPNINFDFLVEESDGTRRLFLFLLTIFDVIQKGKTIIIDEIENSFHPSIVEFIIKLFNTSKSAQLIYTTHNTNLLDLKKMRKDQIYFCNKKDDASSELYSLYDFKDFRESMDVENAYLQGRFGAIPIMDDSESKIRRLIDEQ